MSGSTGLPGDTDRYAYPDAGDIITSTLVGVEGSPYARYWDASDRRALNMMRGHIEVCLRGAPRGERALLDAGCGEGRLLPALVDLFDHVVAVEPDASRLERARGAAERASITAKVEFACTTVQALVSKRSFDIVLSSHVLQHLSTDDVPAMLHALSRPLRPGGLLLLTTCHSTSDEDAFEECRTEAGGAQRSPISERRFNDLVHVSDGALRSHYFTRASLVDALDALSLSIVDFWVFHVAENDLRALFEEQVWTDGAPDVAVNAQAHLQVRYGEDMLVVARKQG